MPADLSSFLNKIISGDACQVLRKIPDESIDCVVTSPPYFRLRDYGVSGQIGLERSFPEYIDNLLKVFDEVKRVLKPSGTCWIVLGDTYASSHHQRAKLDLRSKAVLANPRNNQARRSLGIAAKCLLQLPNRFAIAMTERGWILRNEIIWHKPNAIPVSVRDRFTVDFEKVFFFVKSPTYYFDQDSLREPFKSSSVARMRRTVSNKHKNLKVPGQTVQGMHRARAHGSGEVRLNPLGRNRRCVWSIPTQPFKEAHFAVYPPGLINKLIIAGCPKNGIVLDPFIGSGTTALEARHLDRRFIGVELNQAYVIMTQRRIDQRA